MSGHARIRTPTRDVRSVRCCPGYTTCRRPRAELNRLLWLRGPPSCPVDYGGMEDPTGLEPHFDPWREWDLFPVDLRVRGRRPDLHRRPPAYEAGAPTA